jgi:hypothetical protein
MIPAFFNMAAFRFQRLSWINKACFIPGEWDLYPCQIGNNCASDGPALDRNSEDEQRPGRYVIRTPPREFVWFPVELTHC